jgi:hypothetical protein
MIKTYDERNPLIRTNFRLFRKLKRRRPPCNNLTFTLSLARWNAAFYGGKRTKVVSKPVSFDWGIPFIKLICN